MTWLPIAVVFQEEKKKMILLTKPFCRRGLFCHTDNETKDNNYFAKSFKYKHPCLFKGIANESLRTQILSSFVIIIKTESFAVGENFLMKNIFSLRRVDSAKNFRNRVNTMSLIWTAVTISDVCVEGELVVTELSAHVTKLCRRRIAARVWDTLLHH